MNWRLAQLLRQGAIAIALMAQRVSDELGGSSGSAVRMLRERFAGVTDRTITAVMDRVTGAYQAGIAYNRLSNPNSVPSTPPVDIREPLRREYGAPPPDPATGTNKRYSYLVDVQTALPNADGTGFMSFPIQVHYHDQLTNAELDEKAVEGTTAFLTMLRDDYQRSGIDPDTLITGIRVIGATLGYNYPSSNV